MKSFLMKDTCCVAIRLTRASCQTLRLIHIPNLLPAERFSSRNQFQLLGFGYSQHTAVDLEFCVNVPEVGFDGAL